MPIFFSPPRWRHCRILVSGFTFVERACLGSFGRSRAASGFGACRIHTYISWINAYVHKCYIHRVDRQLQFDCTIQLSIPRFLDYHCILDYRSRIDSRSSIHGARGSRRGRKRQRRRRVPPPPFGDGGDGGAGSVVAPAFSTTMVQSEGGVLSLYIPFYRF